MSLSSTDLSVLPVPKGTRILVKMYPETEKVSESSMIYRPQSRQSDEQDATIKAQVLALGDDAYEGHTQSRPILRPYCKVGDWIMLGSFSGNRFSVAGDESEYRIVQDTAVIAVLPQPEKIERFSRA